MNEKKITISILTIVLLIIIGLLWYNGRQKTKSLEKAIEQNNKYMEEILSYKKIIEDNNSKISLQESKIAEYEKLVVNLSYQVAQIRNDIRNIPRTIISGTTEEAVVIINKDLGKDAFVKANIDGTEGYFTKEMNIKPLAIIVSERGSYKILSEKLTTQNSLKDSIILSEREKYKLLQNSASLCDSLYMKANSDLIKYSTENGQLKSKIAKKNQWLIGLGVANVVEAGVIYFLVRLTR